MENPIWYKTNKYTFISHLSLSLCFFLSLHFQVTAFVYNNATKCHEPPLAYCSLSYAKKVFLFDKIVSMHNIQ